MRLAEFILSSVEPILAEWEAFARSIGAGSALEQLVLRDHAEQILRATARDMLAPQTSEQQSSKSMGHGGGRGAAARNASEQLDHASDEHALGRVESGFDLLEVVSEYRALRASVIRLWRRSKPDPDDRDLADLTRFNESIDQSLTKAIASYTARVNRSRDMFLAILSHDLRNPLSAVTLQAKLLANEPRLDEHCRGMASGITHSADVIARMISDLLEFTRSRLGSGMPVALSATDLGALCTQVVKEFKAAHPDRMLRLRCDGDLTGQWDPQRLRQAISNLVANALRHGAADGPVDIHAVAAAAVPPARGEVVVTVHNQGPPIPPERLATLFDPVLRAPRDLHKPRPEGSLGLGLYIVRQIATAHGGGVEAKSSKRGGTTFTLRLPRGPATAPDSAPPPPQKPPTPRRRGGT